MPNLVALVTKAGEWKSQLCENLGRQVFAP